TDVASFTTLLSASNGRLCIHRTCTDRSLHSQYRDISSSFYSCPPRTHPQDGWDRDCISDLPPFERCLRPQSNPLHVAILNPTHPGPVARCPVACISDPCFPWI